MSGSASRARSKPGRRSARGGAPRRRRPAAGRPLLFDWSRVEEERLNEKMTRKMVVGRKEMIGRLRLAKGALVPPHKHPSEQITMVLSGALRFTVDDRAVTVRAGQVLVIPPDVVHSAVALEDCDDIDAFSPLRLDWLSGEDSYLRGPSGRRSPGSRRDRHTGLELHKG